MPKKISYNLPAPPPHVQKHRAQGADSISPIGFVGQPDIYEAHMFCSMLFMFCLIHLTWDKSRGEVIRADGGDERSNHISETGSTSDEVLAVRRPSAESQSWTTASNSGSAAVDNDFEGRARAFTSFLQPKGGTAQTQWGNQIEFLLACVGYAVGLGNIWRFPYLCFQNGGGAFLLPYIICLFLAGLPIFYLELSIGQFSSLGPSHLFEKISPIFQGLGWAMVVVSFIVSIYYNIIMAWVLFYLYQSIAGCFSWPSLAWDTCRGHWNTINCISNREDDKCIEKLGVSTAVYFNFTCHVNNTEREEYFQPNDVVAKLPADEYFNNYLYGLKNSSESDSITFEHLGDMQWLKIVLPLAIMWVVVFLCLVRGVESVGKVVYFTATFPYVVLTILTIRGCTLPGDGPLNGILYYITPDMDKLMTANVWRFAATQIFYSLGPGFGSLHSMARYSRFDNNCWRDAIVVAIINCFTSIIAGFAVFSTLGYLAAELKKDVADVLDSGPGLAFIAYPEGIVRMQWAPVISILFFFMLMTLGLGSQMGMVQVVITAVTEQVKAFENHKKKVVFGVCLSMFLCGLPLCLEGGIYIFTIFDSMSGTYSLLVIGLTEFTVVMYVYGIRKFIKDLQMMLGIQKWPLSIVVGKQGWYWRIAWTVVAPVLTLGIFIFSCVKYEQGSYNHYEFPPSAENFGWAMAFTPVVVIPLVGLGRVIYNAAKGRPLSDLWRPAPDWGPATFRARYKANKRAMEAGRVKGQYSTKY